MSMFRLKGSIVIVSAAIATFASVWPAYAIDCTCRFRGSDFQLGDQVCLNTPKGLTMAQCQMVLNNTSWQLLNEQCPLGQNAAPIFDIEPQAAQPAILRNSKADAG